MVDCTEVATSLNSYKPLVSLFNFVFADFSDRVAFCHQTAIFFIFSQIPLTKLQITLRTMQLQITLRVYRLVFYES